MKKSTKSVLTSRLMKEIENHPHRDELLTLMAEQVQQDTYIMQDMQAVKL